jgi:EAL domain-containing protein (putative c-di-GMP-specific phosphodiesterase class I)
MPASSFLFEILEHQTEITQEMHEALDLAVKLGFPIALDDIDLRIPFDRERVFEFGDRCQIVKLRREVIRDYRNGLYPTLPEDLHMLTQKCDVLILAEGVPFQLQDQVSNLPVSATQSMHDKVRPQVA